MSIAMTGLWEDLVSRSEFRGHQVKIMIADTPLLGQEGDRWLESLRRMASGGVQITRPADDSREGIYGDAE